MTHALSDKLSKAIWHDIKQLSDNSNATFHDILEALENTMVMTLVTAEISHQESAPTLETFSENVTTKMRIFQEYKRNDKQNDPQ